MQEPLGPWTKRPHLTKAKKEKASVWLKFWLCNTIFTLGLCILNRGQPSLKNSERITHTI